MSFSPHTQCPSCSRTIRLKSGAYAPHLDRTGRLRCDGTGRSAGRPHARQKRMRSGRKSELEMKVEARLKEMFAGQGVTTCELQCADQCLRDNQLQWCHLDKRRHCSVEEWMCGVVLGCSNCHSESEALGREVMRQVLTDQIELRGWRPTVFAFRDLWPELAAYFGGRWVREIVPRIERGE